MPNAIIFGATSGIGNALIPYLINDGYAIAITGRRQELLDQIKAEYSNHIVIYQNDIQDVKQTETVFQNIVAELNTVNLIIHCSGIGYENPELHWKEEYDTIKTNVIGATKIYDLAFHLFKKQDFGHLAAISSIASLRGSRGAPAYFASKAYQVNYLESLYLKTKEVKGRNIYNRYKTRIY